MHTTRAPPPLPQVNGESRRSHKLRVGWYAQHFVDALDYNENPVDYLLRRFPEARMKPEVGVCVHVCHACNARVFACVCLTPVAVPGASQRRA